jgi:hypothetical protein
VIHLIQVDGGGTPNIALMRLSSHFKDLGHTVQFHRIEHIARIPDITGEIYASAIFSKSTPIVSAIRAKYPNAIIGGTYNDTPLVELGGSPPLTLEDIGVSTLAQDYSLYPLFPHSIGFTQRGCRLRCSFCCVPRKEGAVRAVSSIRDIWRGPGHSKNILLLDNDFFGQSEWRDRIKEIRDGGFKVSFNQGINARFLSDDFPDADEAAEALASIKCFDDQFKRRRLYTAWDNKKDEQRLMSGLQRLIKAGFNPRALMVYILIGYCHKHKGAASTCPSDCLHKDTLADREYRRVALRRLGVLPYPMPYERTKELVGFQRWVLTGYDRHVPWHVWEDARYQPKYVDWGWSKAA